MWHEHEGRKGETLLINYMNFLKWKFIHHLFIGLTNLSFCLTSFYLDILYVCSQNEKYVLHGSKLRKWRRFCGASSLFVCLYLIPFEEWMYIWIWIRLIFGINLDFYLVFVFFPHLKNSTLWKYYVSILSVWSAILVSQFYFQHQASYMLRWVSVPLKPIKLE